MSFKHNDTIVALSTPPGIGAIGVIRLSGPKALEISNQVFKGNDLTNAASHTLHHGWVRDGEAIIDEVVAGIFVSPKSYTGEHVVELSCHGSPYVQQRIIEVLLKHGARLAEAGEFTLRGFLNGKMDLSQAEAVADLIASTHGTAHELALQQMRGGFSRVIATLREQLLKFAALVNLELDFSEEDVEFADKEALYKLVRELLDEVEKLRASFVVGNVLKNGVATVIAGRPNAGKSTLLNALLNEERAIVSDLAGTTRDTIEEVLNIRGILFRLIDTAGIRDANDAIERLGVERTMEKIRTSALVVYVFDVLEISTEEVAVDLKRLHTEGSTLICVGNKVDGWEGDRSLYPEETVFISAKDKQHLKVLEDVLYKSVTGGATAMDQTIVSNARHLDALNKTAAALIDVLEGLDNNISGELLALDIRNALEYLGEITGEVTNEDLLDFIFSKFCIGK